MRKTAKRVTAFFISIIMIMSVGMINVFAAEKIRSGDVSGDGKITAADARTILRIAAQLSSVDKDTLNYADADGNGFITSADARLVLRVSAMVEDISSLAEFTPGSNVEVAPTPPEYTSNIKELTICEGDSQLLDYFIVSDRANASWESSNPESVKVDSNGIITAAKKGFSCIILETEDAVFYYDITVKTPVQMKIDTFRNKYPDGYYWNNHTPSTKYPDVTETPCDDHESGRYAYCKGQCAGFAALMFQEVYGESMYDIGKKGVTWDTVKIGDYIRLVKHHSIYIIDVLEEGDVIGYDHNSGKNILAQEKTLIVVHCNWGWTCNIIWDDVFTQKYAIDPNYSYSAS